MLSENAKKIMTYLREIGDDNVTAADVAKELGFEKKSSVDGVFTSFQKKNYGFRQEVKVEAEDGSTTTVKFLKLTDAGKTVDMNAEEA